MLGNWLSSLSLASWLILSFSSMYSCVALLPSELRGVLKSASYLIKHCLPCSSSSLLLLLSEDEEEDSCCSKLCQIFNRDVQRFFLMRTIAIIYITIIVRTFCFSSASLLLSSSDESSSALLRFAPASSLSMAHHL